VEFAWANGELTRIVPKTRRCSRSSQAEVCGALCSFRHLWFDAPELKAMSADRRFDCIAGKIVGRCGTALRKINAKEIFMTSKEKAELHFNQERLSGVLSPIPEYEQRARVERTKIAKLRVLRLAREAELAPKPEKRAARRRNRHPYPQLSRTWNRPLRSVGL
jgi:hypothetical protein